MATRKDVERQFAVWNVLGTGPSTLTAGNWYFRRHVLFYQLRPYKRFVQRASGTKIMLSQMASASDAILTKPTMFNMPGNDKVPAYAYEHWTLPEIGVLSRFEGDELSEAELHERHRFLFVAELAAFIDDYVRPLSGEQASDGTVYDSLVGRVDRLYARYHNYAVTFGLKWGELPKFYRTDIAAAIVGKRLRYHDPKVVAQRERSHARKVARAAFELDRD